MGQNKQNSPIFVRKKRLKIKKVEKQSSHGSLFFADNPENYLFKDIKLDRIGDVIKVLVQSSLADPNKPATQEADPEKLQDELIAALPKFAPVDGKSPLPVTSIRFKIDRKLPNGDLIVSYYRTSKNDTQSNAIRVEARIPRRAVMKQDPVTTTDLLDIDWYERADDETIERDSLAWQDEYTLRISGFGEAKTKYAEAIEGKEKILKVVSEKLKDRIELVGQERLKLAESRQDLETQRTTMDGKVKGLNNKIDEKSEMLEEQKSVIKQQQEQIDELQKQLDEKAEDEG